ncbi:MAG: hypothetical protein KGY66_08890 [Candidatus Thermoplasmatota archaeon]|nr:hypothetical protein [Candidatus Thermoplasmatota archaeon]
MSTEKVTVIMILAMIFFSLSSLATIGEKSDPPEDDEFCYSEYSWSWGTIGSQYANHIDEDGDDFVNNDSLEDEVEDFIPEWLIEREISVVSAIIVLSGLVFFMIFAVILHSKKRKNYRK